MARPGAGIDILASRRDMDGCVAIQCSFYDAAPGVEAGRRLVPGGVGSVACSRWGQGGGVLVAGSLAWGIVMDGFRPDRYAVIGCLVRLVRLVGVAVTMYPPATPDPTTVTR